MSQTHHFAIDARLCYHVRTPGWLLLNVAASQCAGQEVTNENLTCSGGQSWVEQSAPDGVTRFHALDVAAGECVVDYEAKVTRTVREFADSWEPREASLVELPPAVARFLYPSRYCESDKLVRFAAKQFGVLSPGHSRVMAICNWIHEQIDYQPGATNEHSSAADCLLLRAGVCRDFAHLGIAFCRALGIPARYGSSYACGLPNPDFHAFFEVWLGDRWWHYDATRLAPQAGFILIGTGHDAADNSVATMSQGVQFISADLRVEKVSPGDLDYTTSPIAFD
ncbi:MAG: transglutaminase-like domain-containing protein [Chthoniobacterales bacterium]